MRIAHTNMAGMLWVEAVCRRWSLRRMAGESRWQLALHMARWLRLCVRQTRWLRSLDARETMRRAVRADPRLYERWHHPYISTHFDLDERRRIINAHYAFVSRHFPARLRERLVQGGGMRVARLRLEGGAEASLHLRKPSRGDAGELNLLLLTADKQVLASCTLTFDRADSVIIGAMRGAGPHTPFEATREFIQGCHGLHPRDLLMSLVRELAARHGLSRIRAVASHARVADPLHDVATAEYDAFWREQGGLPAASGCHELPLSLAPPPCAGGRYSRREKRRLQEAFRQTACAAFAEGVPNQHNPATRRAVALARERQTTASGASGRRCSLMAAGLR